MHKKLMRKILIDARKEMKLGNSKPMERLVEQAKINLEKYNKLTKDK